VKRILRNYFMGILYTKKSVTHIRLDEYFFKVSNWSNENMKATGGGGGPHFCPIAHIS
jgi:hypothetical protein